MTGKQPPLVNAMRDVRSWMHLDYTTQDRMIDGLLVSYIQGAYEPSGWIVHQDYAGNRQARVLKATTREGASGMPIAEIVAGSSRTVDLSALESAGTGWLRLLEEQMGEPPVGAVPEPVFETIRLNEEQKRKLLGELREAQSLPKHRRGLGYESVAAHMFEALGTRVVIQDERPMGTPGTGVVDLSVWSPELEQINSNPLLVAVKGVESGRAPARLATQLSAYTPAFGTWTLLLLQESHPIDDELYRSLQSKHVLMASLSDAIESVATESLLNFMLRLISSQSERAGV